VAAAVGHSLLEACFLEFAEPAIAEGFENLANRDVTRIVVAPLLLFRAGHAERDIPAAVMAAAARHPKLVVDWADHLGCHPAIVELSKRRFDEALADADAVPAEQTALVVVGRGSYSAAAAAEMLAFVELRRRVTPVGMVGTCFLAMAEPLLESALGQAAASGARRIVVQPHLLFAGTLVDRVGRCVARFANEHPQSTWMATAHLGPCALLSHAVVDRASAASRRSTVMSASPTPLDARPKHDPPA
jgi:sirohydrochlorin cobaltochelatase